MPIVLFIHLWFPFPKASRRWWSSTTLLTDLFALPTLTWWGITQTPVASLASKVEQLWRGHRATQGCAWVSLKGLLFFCGITGGPTMNFYGGFFHRMKIFRIPKNKGMYNQCPTWVQQFQHSSNPSLLPRFGRAVARVRTAHLKSKRRAAHRFLREAAAGDNQLDMDDKVSKFWMEHANLQPIFAFLARQWS